MDSRHYFKHVIADISALALAACAQTGLAVKPKKGDCLLFWSLRPDGITKDTKSLHAGCPVCPNGRSGEALKCDKWSATKWIRVGRHD